MSDGTNKVFNNDDLMRFIDYVMRGEGKAAENTVLEAMAREGFHAKTFIYASKVCRVLAERAPYGSGFAYGANSCAAALEQFGNDLGKYLDTFGRP